jgi:hypothetical protein
VPAVERGQISGGEGRGPSGRKESICSGYEKLISPVISFGSGHVSLPPERRAKARRMADLRVVLKLSV